MPTLRHLAGACCATVAVALVAAAWGGYVPAHRAPLWLSLLIIALPLLGVAAAMLAAAALLRHRWHAAATLGAALLIAWPSLRLVAPLRLPAGTARPTDGITVMTFNVAAFTQSGTRPPNATLECILNSGADVVMLQEVWHDGWGRPKELLDTTFAPAQVAKLDSLYPYRSHDNDDVTIYSRHPYTRVEITPPLTGFDMVDYYAAMEHHYAVAYDLHLPAGRQLRLVGLHLHSWNFSRRQRSLFGGKLGGELDAMPGSAVYGLTTAQLMIRSIGLRAAEAQAVRRAIDTGPPNVIVCGDFNDVPASHAYRLVRGGDLRDAWADAGAGYASTFRRYNFALRIDHVLYRGALHPVAMRRLTGGTSDHYPQLATFEFAP